MALVTGRFLGDENKINLSKDLNRRRSRQLSAARFADLHCLLRSYSKELHAPLLSRLLSSILMSTVLPEIAKAQESFPSPHAVTDPRKIASKPNAQVEPKSLTIEKLFYDPANRAATWSPDGKSIAFISNMSGRNNLWVVPGAMADGQCVPRSATSVRQRPHGLQMASGSPISPITTVMNSGIFFLVSPEDWSRGKPHERARSPRRSHVVA